VGTYLETVDPDGIEGRLDLLAHHFWLSDDTERKQTYLARAAEAAQRAYNNDAAIRYLERLTPLLEGRDRIGRLLLLGQVFDVTGDIARAEAVVTEARASAVELDDLGLIARCDHSLASSARRMGRFDDAVVLLAQARAGFEAVGDEAGVADVLQVTGTVAAQRGDTTAARERYTESLAIRERLGDEAGVAALTSNLGIVAQQTGDGEAARSYADRALALYTKLGNRRHIGTCLVNLAWMDGMAGDHESERRRCEEAIRVASEVGDRLNLAIAWNNLGDALRELDRLDDAGEAYATAVETYRDLGDLGPLMALLEDVAILAGRRDDDITAFSLIGASDALRRALAAPRSEASEEVLAEALRPSRDAIGATAADAARARGAEHDAVAAIELAIGAARGARLD
jgi:tetratricopeptide (TPR) repeat protein